MATAPHAAAADLAVARDHLAAGRWDDARDVFARALSVTGAPEAAEGLGWAAWWLDDAAGVRAARRRAHRGYLRRGDRVAAGRVAVWIGADRLDFDGAIAGAAGWLRRARGLLGPAAPPAERGWLDFHEGYLARVCGDDRRATRLARRARLLGGSAGTPDLEMLGLALEGASLVRGRRVAAGMALLDEATALAVDEEPELPIAGAWTCCLLVSCCLSLGDMPRASEWCGSIAAFAERWGSRYMLAFCRAEYGAVALWEGRWSDAETLLGAAADDFARSRPAFAGEPIAGLAELRRRQGRAAEARALLDRARGVAAADTCRGRLALDAGRPAVAAEVAHRCLRRATGPTGPDDLPALELLVEAGIARGDPEAARRAVAGMRAVAGAMALPGPAAAVALADGRLAAATGDHARAREMLEDALDGYAACGAPWHAALVRRDLATSLAALGRRDEAREEAAEAARSLDALGAAGEARRARRLLQALTPGAGSGVTRREREVLALLARGLTNAEIAERLTLSEHTVHRHVGNILRKLGLGSRTAAAVHAVSAGIVAGRPGD